MTKKEQINHYIWHGINQFGNESNGLIAATTPLHAKLALHKQGITCHRITKKIQIFSTMFHSKEITLFFRQMSTMIKAGISLIQACDFIAQNQTHWYMKQLTQALKQEIAIGISFSEALAKYPKHFDSFTVNLLATGEKTGKLETILEKIVSYREQNASLKAQIKKALSYPLIVFFFALSVTLALLIFVVPQFEALYKNFGAPLPIYTKLIINLSRHLVFYWEKLILLIILLGIAFTLAQKKLKAFNEFLQTLLLKSPLFGRLYRKIMVTHYSSNLAISLAAGLPMIDALQTVTGIIKNSSYLAAIKMVREEIIKGNSLQLAMHQSNFFPVLAQQMVGIGEESGTLETMLHKLAIIYEDETKRALGSLINLFEPIVMLMLGILVGGLVISMYLPLFKLGTIL